MGKVIMMFQTFPLLDEYEMRYVEERHEVVPMPELSEPYLILN